MMCLSVSALHVLSNFVMSAALCGTYHVIPMSPLRIKNYSEGTQNSSSYFLLHIASVLLHSKTLESQFSQVLGFFNDGFDWTV